MDTNIRPPPRARRVDSTSIADLIDVLIGNLNGQSNTSVYRYLGRRLGIHPTTVLRYHRGRLQTVVMPIMRAITTQVDGCAMEGRANQVIHTTNRGTTTQ